MNRSVLDRQMFRNGGVVPMQAGGAPMPGAPMPGAPMPGAPMPGAPMPGAPMPAAPMPAAPMPAAPMPAVEEGIPSGVDPALMEDLLRRYSQNMEGLEDAEDYETVINEIRGDDRSIDDRYDELAEVVGEEDAHRTPESVLTLVQPVMLMASVDDGIGSLAQEEMMTPVEGPMAEGIMSTVDMGPSGQAEGGPAPVNFSQGGAVQHMNLGGAAGTADSRLQTLYRQELALLSPIYDPAKRAAALEKEREYAQAGMLFDVASAAAQAAFTPVEKLGPVFEGLGKGVGRHVKTLSEAEQLAKATEDQLRLGAARNASSRYATERAAESARQAKPVGDPYKVTITDGLGNTTTVTRPMTQGAYESLVKQFGEGNVSIEPIFKPGTRRSSNIVNFELPNGHVRSVDVSTLTGQKEAATHLKAGARRVSLTSPDSLTYLTDPERLRRYANDELGDETALFEQTLAKQQEPRYAWDGTSYTLTSQPALARQIQSALRARVQNGFEIPKIAGFNASSSQENRPSLGSTGSSSDDGAADKPSLGSTGSSSDDGAADKLSLNSTEFKQQLFSPDMGVNYDSPLWEDVPLNIIDKDIAYYRATGPSQVGQRISNVISEYGRELLGLPPMNEEGRELVTASKDINNLREVINQELVNWSDDRVLKTTQDALRSLAKDLTPGIFKFDEPAAATLQSLKGNMGRAFQYYASMDPEYTPEAQGRFTEKQVTDARARTSQIQSLLAEVIALEKIYTGYLKSVAPGGPTGGVGGVGSARSMIRQIAERRKVERKQ